MYDDILKAHSQNKERYEISKKRQSAVWLKQKPDRQPLLLYTNGNSQFPNLVKFNHKNIFDSNENMFFSELNSTIRVMNNFSDAVPSVRANMGCGVFPTMFGIKQGIYEDKMPWITKHLSKEEIQKITPEKLVFSDDFNRGLEFMAFMKEKLRGTGVMVFPMDVQGAYDTAHLVFGDQIFYEMYDDDEFVHYLLELCCECIKIGMKKVMEIIDDDYVPHYNGLVIPRSLGGIKLSEDTSTLLSKDLIEEFAAPYMEKLLKHFGGGYIHYCGRNDHLLQKVLDSEYAYGLNFGNPDKHDMEDILRRCTEKGKIFYGSTTRFENECWQDYFARTLSASATKDGLYNLILSVNCNVDEAELINEAWENCLK